MLLIWRLILALCFLVLRCVSKPIKIGTLNDIHYEPFFKPGASLKKFCRGDSPLDWLSTIEIEAYQFGEYGCDAPERLIKMMFDKMNEIDPDIEVLLVGGDFIAHGFSVELADKEHDQYGLLKENLDYFFLEILAKKFPKAVILPTIGNNDIKYHYIAPQQNYSAPDYYPFMYKLIFEKIPANRKLNLKGVKETYLKFGGYRIDYNDEISFIGFNSLYYNDRTPSNDTAIKDEQFNWLNKTVSSSESGRKFVLFFHIYPGVYFIGYVRFHWERPAVLRFNDIIQRNLNKFALIYGSHSHFPDLKVGFSHEFSIPQLLKTETKHLKHIPTWAMLIGPSISPVFKNNPGFQLLQIENGVARNISWHFFELYRYPKKESDAVFNQIDFKRDLGIDEFTPKAVLVFIKTIIEDKYTLYKYLAYKIGYRGKNVATALANYQELAMLTLNEEYQYYCSLLNMLRTDYYA